VASTELGHGIIVSIVGGTYEVVLIENSESTRIGATPLVAVRLDRVMRPFFVEAPNPAAI
jgi:hypothetical protein